MRIIDIEERGNIYFPRSDLMSENGQSLILTETWRRKVIEVKDIEDGSRLMALGSIGYLPLTASIVLNIIPKFPIENLWVMLEVGGESYSRILPVLKRYQTSVSQTPSFLLARSFCFYLREALSIGLARGYYKEERAGHYRPKVEFGPTINKYISHGDPINTVSQSYSYGLHNLANRAVKTACADFIRIIPGDETWKEERDLIRDALENLSLLPSSRPSYSDILLEPDVPTRLKPSYLGMAEVYRLSLGGSGISFAYEQSGRELPSFLFKLEDIFESFIRKSFAAVSKESGVSILDGNIKPGKLFTDTKAYDIKSDIFFRRGKKNVIAVGEVKYKPSIKEVDRYQLISHVTASKCKVGVMFSPANPGEPQSLSRIGKLPTEAVFYHYRLSLEGDMRKNAERMVREVLDLMPLA
ncbi:McrC family protein [Xanthomonas translucens pv. translucens]|uniref:McrC family protein n=1 Tax=Xanthomonas campestris pv. translucens TaxID=343 RepID=UPI0021B82541|nr:McrC family protein [Xanthomonas translucens]MCT8284933.1 McrC family protein [Xanthomonas translucens pv. translucens]MCT8302591.1 McrC family protein [Xanthomonas translucens pv. translucens]